MDLRIPPLESKTLLESSQPLGNPESWYGDWPQLFFSRGGNSPGQKEALECLDTGTLATRILPARSVCFFSFLCVYV